MSDIDFGTSSIVFQGTIKDIETRSIGCNTEDGSINYTSPPTPRYTLVNYPSMYYSMYGYPYMVPGGQYPIPVYPIPPQVPGQYPENRRCDYCAQSYQTLHYYTTPTGYNPHYIYVNQPPAAPTKKPSRQTSVCSSCIVNTSRLSSESKKSPDTEEKQEEVKIDADDGDTNFRTNTKFTVHINKIDTEKDVESVTSDDLIEFANNFLKIDDEINSEQDMYPTSNSSSKKSLMTNDEDYRNFIEDAKSDKLNDLLNPTSYEGEFVAESGDYIHSLGSRKDKSPVLRPPFPPEKFPKNLSEVPMRMMISSLKGQPRESDSKLTQLLNHLEKETRLTATSSCQDIKSTRLDPAPPRTPTVRLSRLRKSSTSDFRIKSNMSPCYWLFVVLIPFAFIALLMITTIIEINRFAREGNLTKGNVTFTEKEKIGKIETHIDLILFYAPQSDYADKIVKKLKQKGFITRAESFAQLDDLKMKFRNVSASPQYKWGLFGGKFVYETKVKVKYFGVYFENLDGGLNYRIINSAPSTKTLYMNRDTIPFFKYSDNEVYGFPVLSDTNILQFVVDSTYVEIFGNGMYQEEVIRRYNFKSFPSKKQIEDEMEISNLIYLIYFIRSCILLYKVATTIRSDSQSGFKEIINMHGVSKFYQEMCWFLVFYAPLALVLCIESLFFISWFQHLGFLLFATNIFFVTCIFISIFIGIVSPNNFWVFCFLVLWTTSGFLKNLGINYQISSHSSQTITVAESILIILPPNCFKLLYSYMHYMHYIVSRSDQEVSMFFYQASYTHIPSFFILLFAMIISLLITLLLIWYVEMVFPGTYGIAEKFNFIFTKSYWRKRAKARTHSQDILPLVREIGVEARPIGTAPVICIRNLSKVYGKQPAVKSINLDIYRNYITVIVGHNGSGKTTTMHMITGMVEPTSGTIWMTYPKDRMGLCHEYNLFSPEMSIFEHIRFFAMLRGTSYIDSKEEANLTLEYFNINSKVKYMPKQISYGMKRKVSIAMAVVGGSKLLILDEPTSGLDPYTKREIWNAILKMRGAYTILVSTHNIEEAEVLGDRIIIINDGHVLCHGSVEFLKTYYDTGYVLNIVGESEMVAEEILKEVHRFIPDASIKHVLAQRVGIFLPRVKSFVVLELMTHLEENKQDLKIINISFNIMNLEEIFLKSGGYRFQYKTKTFQPLEIHNKATIMGCRLFFHQLIALVFKRILYYYEEWLTMLLLLVIGLLLMYMSTNMENVAFQEIESTEFKLSLYKNTHVYNENNNSKFSTSLREIVTAEGSLYNEIKFFDKTIKEVMLTDPFTYIEKLVVGFDKQPTLHFSKFAFHSKAIGINILSNIYCKEIVEKKCTILTALESSSNPEDALKTGGSYSIIILNVFVSFLIFLVILLNTREEQVAGVKDLQVFSGIPRVFYLFTTYLMDILLYLLYVLVIHLGYHLFMEFLCGTVMIPIVYMTAYIRLNHGMIALICITFVPPYIFLLAKTNPEFKVNTLAWIPGLTKSIAFYLHEVYHVNDCHELLPTYTDKFYAILMAFQIIILWTIYLMFEYGAFSIMFSRQQRLGDVGENDDSDVEAEEKACKRLVDKMKTKASRQKVKPDIIFYKIFKCYASQKQKQAVLQDISFYVPKGSCMGLVGNNGSGKSAIYRTMIGADPPTSGRIYLMRKRSRLLNQFYTQRQMGFCPQHDALCPSLSGRQMLWIMAIIKGISLRKVCYVVNLWLERVDLDDMANKKISQYTRGMKKRLNIAIALLGNLPILLLDEPTEGVDPVGKRQIWNLLGWAKTMGQSIILITRSMEETEILCDKIALLVKGRFRCIGDIHYLKVKYTHGYTVTLQLRPANPYTMDDDISQIKKLIVGQYKCELKEETLSNLVYRILDEDLRMSSVFQFFDNLKSDFMILSDISVTDTSLEQLFLSIGEGEVEYI